MNKDVDVKITVYPADKDAYHYTVSNDGDCDGMLNLQYHEGEHHKDLICINLNDAEEFANAILSVCK